MRYVIIGNGVAGINAASEIRRADGKAEISIVSYESDHFFSRTALMYAFCGQLSERCIEPYERDYYKKMNFTRVRDRISAVDYSKKTLTLESGGTLAYDRLLIASGSVGRRATYPGSDLDGVGRFVTWDNLEWLKEKSKDARAAVVIGGGLIGIEALEILHLAGIEVTFLVRESHLWPVAFSETESDMVVAHVKEHGCHVLLGEGTDEVVGKNGKVIGLKTDAGKMIECDIALFAIGVQPQTEFLKGSGFELDRFGGIVVDEKLGTGLQDVWAAGDCTSVIWFNGVRRPEQLWYTGRDQGIAAGKNMAASNGMQTAYKRATFYNSAKFFDIEYTTAGYVNFNFDGEHDWYQRETGTNISQRITYLQDGTVIGFNMLGSRWDHGILVRWVDEKRKIGWVLEHLHEAAFDEEFFRKFKVLAPAPVV
ncbi:MAG: FAD-dependent oxidoreductase [candidate division Zixibacteria bacterium]|nr:FAD-dependent oxidoreductase [candidate division Zixibacteria bacterium]